MLLAISSISASVAPGRHWIRRWTLADDDALASWLKAFDGAATGRGIPPEGGIEAAYKRLARKYHPDVNPGDKTAEATFKEINEANEVLGDPEKRRKYDELGANWRDYDTDPPKESDMCPARLAKKAFVAVIVRAPDGVPHTRWSLSKLSRYLRGQAIVVSHRSRFEA